MVKGLNTFQKYFAEYENQYVLIGGAACDIVFESNDASFRAAKDHTSCVQTYLLQQDGSSGYQSQESSVHHGAFRDRGHHGHLYASAV